MLFAKGRYIWTLVNHVLHLTILDRGAVPIAEWS